VETQVVVIGGGLMGTAMARELARYQVDTVVVERYPDVSFGISKASNGMIYSGLTWLVSIALKSIVTNGGGADAHAEKERLVLEGFDRWEAILNDLDIPYRRDDVIVIARNEEELERLKRMQEMARPEWGITLLDQDSLFSMEPNVTREAIAALYDKGHALTNYPWDIVMAMAENAKENGVRFMLESEVRGFSRKNGSQVVETTRGSVKTDFIINATGPQAADVAKLADACDFALQYYKGHCLITDRSVGNLVHSAIFWPPTPGVSKVVQPMLSGNLRLGSIYVPIENKDDQAAVREDMETVFERARDLVPALSKKDIIAYYPGLRVFSARDPEEYIIEYAQNNRRFVNVVLRLPGFTPAPVIAEKIVGMLAESGLELSRKEDFNPHRTRIPAFRELPDEEKRKLIDQDPAWGRVVCHCETVTEAEIVEAIRRGATTLDGVKYRTRAGMGRCQANFCGPEVVEILARELNMAVNQITKKGGNSQILAAL